jgi:outer membrane murein-binding lipoprotein Lpp
MLTLESLKTEVDAIRVVVDVAHSEAVKTRHLVDTHAHVFVVHGALLPGQQVVADAPGISLAHTREDLDDLSCGVFDINAGVKKISANVDTLMSDMADVKLDIASLKSEFQLMNQRQDGMDQRQDRMDRNIGAIMRHMGISPDE